ncbi:uncharacterized protein LOC123399003 [Hordeum vulgare subsp. vulgare]|uniref:Predicted protein n=2 Tax=Hordeum vulgare subsp. vulgare TaxID=112509 RepID=F2DUQ9_HORVV|nr:uncharacterized protein LOC123399003 [Hordeum vulgare subsp. vulgare]BAJ98830.1 predicted protein [Hordeum vulgare subsp. vulgare]BAK02437.1 predicted protein [Hordeum vulgare subsp. vulgare]
MLRSLRNLDHVPRSAYQSWIMARNIMGVKDKKNWGKPNCLRHITEGISREEQRWGTKEVLFSHPADNVSSTFIFKNSSHRDGAIYKRSFALRKSCRVTDRDETQLEPMMLSEPADCFPDRERCCVHCKCPMMQIFTLKLASVSINTSPVELYGYIAVRDHLDLLLNYIVNRSRDDPIIAQQGSLIEMTGPKRCIAMDSSVLVEFDIRIKTGEKEEDDLTLIDGATDYCDLTTPSMSFTNRINGDCGAVDITLARVYNAVEATIDVLILKVQNGFNLSLSLFVFVGGSDQEIPLFHGTTAESCGLRRYVIAVEMDTWLQLKFKVGQNGSKNDHLERSCHFKANIHGCACQQIMLQHASLSLKVTWSTVPG